MLDELEKDDEDDGLSVCRPTLVPVLVEDRLSRTVDMGAGVAAGDGVEVGSLVLSITVGTATGQKPN